MMLCRYLKYDEILYLNRCSVVTILTYSAYDIKMSTAHLTLKVRRSV